ncbi:MAG: 6-carboxytetrahydropterin synthase [Blastocatellia bacterium]|nr:6-carboxytetrahydropterin synthase [Blastocatellia bacterium]
MFEIGIAEEFEAAHALEGDFGPATRLHGHTYRVEVRVEARDIDETGVFYDLGRLRADLRAVLDPLHYRNLNDLAALSETNTTAEVVARYIFKQMEPPLRASKVASLKVTVWESPSSFASYRETFEDE